MIKYDWISNDFSEYFKEIKQVKQEIPGFRNHVRVRKMHDFQQDTQKLVATFHIDPSDHKIYM